MAALTGQEIVSELARCLRERFSVNEFAEIYKDKPVQSMKTPCIFISAKEKIGIDKLRNDIYKMVAEIHAGRYPFNNFLW